MIRCSDVCKVIWNSPTLIYRLMLTSFLNRKSICNPFYHTKYVSISHILLYLPSVSNEGFLPFCLYLIPSTLLKRCWNKSSFYCYNPFNLVSVRRAIGYGKKGISVIDSFHLLLLSTVIPPHSVTTKIHTWARIERNTTFASYDIPHDDLVRLKVRYLYNKSIFCPTYQSNWYGYRYIYI